MRKPHHSLIATFATLALAGTLLAGCSSKKTTTATPQTEVTSPEKPSLAGQVEGKLTARVQAISRKNRILTLKFPDDKVAKVKVGPEVRNFNEIGVGDTITADFRDEVELYVAGPDGKPAWSEVEEIKRTPKGVKPGAAIIRAYEYSARVIDIDYASRRVTLKGPDGKMMQVTGGPEVKRFNEIKTGDLVVARLKEAIDIKVEPPLQPSSASRPYRRR